MHEINKLINEMEKIKEASSISMVPYKLTENNNDMQLRRLKSIYNTALAIQKEESKITFKEFMETMKTIVENHKSQNYSINNINAILTNDGNTIVVKFLGIEIFKYQSDNYINLLNNFYLHKENIINQFNDVVKKIFNKIDTYVKKNSEKMDNKQNYSVNINSYACIYNIKITSSYENIVFSTLDIKLVDFLNCNIEELLEFTRFSKTNEEEINRKKEITKQKCLAEYNINELTKILALHKDDINFLNDFNEKIKNIQENIGGNKNEI